MLAIGRGHQRGGHVGARLLVGRAQRQVPRLPLCNPVSHSSLVFFNARDLSSHHAQVPPAAICVGAVTHVRSYGIVSTTVDRRRSERGIFVYKFGGRFLFLGGWYFLF